MLDDVVIQEGEFTTDYFNKLSVRDVIGDGVELVGDSTDAANAAMDRLLAGSVGDDRSVGRVLEQAEDREDVTAAHAAEREIQTDDADFSEKAATMGSGPSTERQNTPRDDALRPQSASLPPETMSGAEIERNAWGEVIQNIDEYMLSVMARQLSSIPLEIPRDKKKSKKKAKDMRKR
jgi:helicase SWR1